MMVVFAAPKLVNDNNFRLERPRPQFRPK